MNNTIETYIHTMLEMSRLYEYLTATDLGLKLFEEGGELAEAISVEKGLMPHKTPKDTPIEEMADVINVLCGIMVKLYPEKSYQQLMQELEEALRKKGEKYASIIKPE